MNVNIYYKYSVHNSTKKCGIILPALILRFLQPVYLMVSTFKKTNLTTSHRPNPLPLLRSSSYLLVMQNISNLIGLCFLPCALRAKCLSYKLIRSHDFPIQTLLPATPPTPAPLLRIKARVLTRTVYTL